MLSCFQDLSMGFGSGANGRPLFRVGKNHEAGRKSVFVLFGSWESGFGGVLNYFVQTSDVLIPSVAYRLLRILTTAPRKKGNADSTLHSENWGTGRDVGGLANGKCRALTCLRRSILQESREWLHSSLQVPPCLPASPGLNPRFPPSNQSPLALTKPQLQTRALDLSWERLNLC